MPTVDVLDLEGNKSGEISLSDTIFGVEPKVHLFHTVLRSQLASRRRGTACTKTRSEVRGSGKKPWRQKGTGRARIGTRASPVWTGGGIVFGPKPRTYSVNVPKKVRKAAVRSALSLKLKEQKIVILEHFDLPEIRTKSFVGHKKSLNLNKVLILTSGENTNLAKSARNVPDVKVLNSAGMNLYDILRFDQLVLTRDVIDYIEKVYGT